MSAHRERGAEPIEIPIYLTDSILIDKDANSYGGSVHPQDSRKGVQHSNKCSEERVASENSNNNRGARGALRCRHRSRRAPRDFVPPSRSMGGRVGHVGEARGAGSLRRLKEGSHVDCVEASWTERETPGSAPSLPRAHEADEPAAQAA
jgi:hypothetical protein